MQGRLRQAAVATVAVVCAAGCGRIGFDPLPQAGPGTDISAIAAGTTFQFPAATATSAPEAGPPHPDGGIGDAEVPPDAAMPLDGEVPTDADASPMMADGGDAMMPGPTITGDCSGTQPCVCSNRERCEFKCTQPPCNVRCLAVSQCSASCANGTCRCGRGSSCDFQCSLPPCSVRCEGNNPQCSAVCDSTDCLCGLDSSCDFVCGGGGSLGGNCAVNCEPGAACLLRCPDRNAGQPGCSFSACWAGTPIVCAGDTATTCGLAPCPI